MSPDSRGNRLPDRGGRIADRPIRVAVAAGCALVSSVVLLVAACAASHEPASRGSAPAGSSAGTVGLLQVNLCDSGIATCFTGRSVAATAALIRAERPDIVTVNEACREDVSVLARAMSATFRGRPVASAFKAAVNRPSDGPYRCRNGEQYGIGVVAAGANAAAGSRSVSGVYPMQDSADPEERVWLCLDAPEDLLACTTHTASTSASVALAQCRYFFGSALPRIAGVHGRRVVFGADLNLPVGRSPGPQSCVPPGYRRVDDGARMDIVVGPGITIRSRTVLDMHATTDHPGLLADLTVPPSATP